MSLVLAVQIEAFLWGLGTAIGELPPYYISKQSGKILLIQQLLKIN